MQRATFIPAIVLAIAACSSSGGPVVSTQVTTQTLQTPGANIDITSTQDRDVITQMMLAPADSVWRQLPGVFLELDIEPTTVDQKDHVIANMSFTVRRSLGGVRLSRYVDCGRNISGAAADQLQILMTLMVQVVADSSQTSTLRSQVQAHGVAEGVSGTQVACASTGALEERIARMVNDALAHRAHK